MAHAVVCESCAATIPAEDVDITTLVARCRQCNAVFDCADQVKAEAPCVRSEEPPSLPAGLTMRHDPNGFTLERSWRGPAIVFFIIFTLFWDGFLVFWYFLAFTQNGPMMMKIVPVLHVIVGVFMTYYTLAMILNATTIRATYNTLSLKHGPMWWPGSRTVDSADIKQLFVKKSSVTQNDQSMWNVMLDTFSGKRLTLVARLTDKDHAMYIEDAIERFLEIKDKRHA